MDIREFLLAEIEKDIATATADREPMWYDAPLPPRLHRCQTATQGVMTTGTHVRRCACGAAQLDNSGIWIERNSRRA